MQPAHLYDYLVKARDRLFDWVRPLPQEQYVREFPYGLKTIRATLLHTASAEWIYPRRVRAETVAIADSPFNADKMPTFSDAEAAWRDLAAQTRGWLAAMTDWDAPVTYRMAPPNAPAFRIRTTRNGIVSQLLFHEVHHRSQVMSMLRQCGVAAQNLDYSALMFVREQEPA